MKACSNDTGSVIMRHGACFYEAQDLCQEPNEEKSCVLGEVHVKFSLQLIVVGSNAGMQLCRVTLDTLASQLQARLAVDIQDLATACCDHSMNGNGTATPPPPYPHIHTRLVMEKL